MQQNTTYERDRNHQAGPDDLRASIGSRNLVRLALDAIQSLSEKNLESARRTPTNYPPQMMLTLIGYCYASGIYGSRQIAQATREDAMVRYICAREYPSHDDIRRFRRAHRRLIDPCMVYILKQAWALRFDAAETEFLGYDWFESVFNRGIQDDAAHRLELATFIDLMDLPD